MYFNFTVYNFTGKPTFWYKLRSFHKQLSAYKHLEVETFFTNYNLFSVEFDCKLTGKDHAGIRLKFDFCGLELEIHFYDSRHWNYKDNCWETKTENEMISKQFDGF